MMSKEAMKLALETSEGIVNADWRKWDELASSAEFERWAKSRANFMATILRQALANEALDRMAENARELGLDYEPAQQEPVAWQPLPCPFCGHIGLDFADGETYRWGVASCGGCGASCGDVRREYPDKGEWHTEAIAEWNKRSPAAQRTWVGLTDEDKAEIKKQANYNWETTAGEYASKVQALTEAKLKEKNT